MRRKFQKFKKDFAKEHRTHIRMFHRLRRHPVMIPVVTLLVLIAVSTGLFFALNGGHSKFKPITSYIAIINDNHVQETVPTDEPTVGALLDKLHITINPGDVVEPSASAQINEDNFRINIY